MEEENAVSLVELKMAQGGSSSHHGIVFGVPRRPQESGIRPKHRLYQCTRVMFLTMITRITKIMDWNYLSTEVAIIQLNAQFYTIS